MQDKRTWNASISENMALPSVSAAVCIALTISAPCHSENTSRHSSTLRLGCWHIRFAHEPVDLGKAAPPGNTHCSKALPIKTLTACTLVVVMLQVPGNLGAVCRSTRALQRGRVLTTTAAAASGQH